VIAMSTGKNRTANVGMQKKWRLLLDGVNARKLLQERILFREVVLCGTQAN
jgi:hypothetical protein